MPVRHHRSRATPGQSCLDWLLGHPGKRQYRIGELVGILGIERDSIVGLFDSGELWGLEHRRIRGTGKNICRVACRDAVATYLARHATADDALRAQRIAEAISTLRDQEHLAQLRRLIDQQLTHTS